MATNAEERKRLLEAGAPASREVRVMLRDYLQRSGLGFQDFARRINYSSVSIRFFLDDAYHRVAGSDLALRCAIREFIDAHPLTPLTESEGKLYETANVRTLRRVFYECLDKQRAGVVYGGPGSQKTFALEHLIAELNRTDLAKNGHGRRAYYVYCPSRVRPNALLKEIAEACGSSPAGDNRRIIRNLRFDFGKRRVVIVMDEAQHLDVDCLETVRQLLDRLRCGLLFAGSHDLIRTFKRSLELEQWNSRLRATLELPGITDDEAHNIVREELGQVSDRKMALLLKEARIPDLRTKEEYISARRLFFSIAAIREDAERSSVH